MSEMSGQEGIEMENDSLTSKDIELVEKPKLVKFNCKEVAADKALDQAIACITKGTGNWRRTNLTIIDQGEFKFTLSCGKCDKTYAQANPASFWQTHTNKCSAEGAPRGQVLNAAGASVCSRIHSIFLSCHVRVMRIVRCKADILKTVARFRLNVHRVSSSY
jgi:hypothetical protein